MNINDVTTLITNIGFPIVACICLYKQNSELTTSITKLSETLKDISNSITNINERISEIENKIECK